MNAVLGVMQLQPVAGAAEGIGEDDVGAGIDEVLVQLRDVLGPGFVPEFRRFTRFQAHGEKRGAGRAVGDEDRLFGEEIGKRIGGHDGYLD